MKLTTYTVVLDLQKGLLHSECMALPPVTCTLVDVLQLHLLGCSTSVCFLA